MLELTGDSSRAFKIVALAASLLLVAAATAGYRAAGPLAAIALVSLAATVSLVAWLVATRRRLQHARERQRLCQQALDTMPQAIFIVDAERLGAPPVYVNAAYAALTGYGVHDAVAQGFDARGIFAGDGDVPALALDADRSSTRLVVRRRDGTTFPAKVELRAAPPRDGGRYLVGTIEDVTAGERATDRESPTPPCPANVKTEPPRLQVDGDGRGTGRFLSWLSHELRSPLNACVMWLDVLALQPQPDKLPKAIEAIKRGLVRQAKLINDLSDAAKVAAGGLEMRFEPVDLVALVGSNVGAWRLVAIGKPIEFQQRIDLDSAIVDGDAERLSLALNHLVENAIHSAPPHGRVDLRVYGAAGACVVEIEDTGPALSSEDAANVHVPLERSKTSAKARSGLGMGIAVAHHVAARHGGSLTATSEGPSTRFVLTLPLTSTALAAGSDGSSRPAAAGDRSSVPGSDASG